MTIEELKKRAVAWLEDRDRFDTSTGLQEAKAIIQAITDMPDVWHRFDADDPTTWPEDDGRQKIVASSTKWKTEVNKAYFYKPNMGYRKKPEWCDDDGHQITTVYAYAYCELPTPPDPADLADWLEAWADHVGLTVDAAVQVALAGQKSRSRGALMVPPKEG